MKKIYNDKNIFDWIVWICLASISIPWCIAFIWNCIPVAILIKSSAILLLVLIYSWDRYVLLSNREIEELITENEILDLEIKHLADPLLYPKKPKNTDEII